jgi:hypothetical protein
MLSFDVRWRALFLCGTFYKYVSLIFTSPTSLRFFSCCVVLRWLSADWMHKEANSGLGWNSPRIDGRKPSWHHFKTFWRWFFRSGYQGLLVQKVPFHSDEVDVIMVRFRKNYLVNILKGAKNKQTFCLKTVGSPVKSKLY